ncbi:germin-like protein subfamily 3 member 4 [Neltuma alba]|uniref:germin-like protein subfamily 3 member 4 n=1 Tax=Neltuma alba TaxID=207710 RepID=UPI0010A304D2|nr:germin-like protein subfamily 3 member 4 [Prosopis alba]XP_028784955.1 germin-like protein subfamily 3 member 4 [Prosopis alba]
MVVKWRVEMNSAAPHFFVFFFVVLTSIKVCVADCDNLQDTCPAASPEEQTIFINGLSCKNPAEIAPHDFKNMDFGEAGSTDNIVRSSMKIISAPEFPGLNTLGLSIGRTDIGVDGMVRPHQHPRATEMIFVVEGVLVAGFLDTDNKIFQTMLNVGDVFVFPRGLFHFFLNRGRGAAILLSVFNSRNPGMESVNTPPLDTAIDSLQKLIPLSDSHIHDFDNFTWTGSDSIFSF